MGGTPVPSQLACVSKMCNAKWAKRGQVALHWRRLDPNAPPDCTLCSTTRPENLVWHSAACRNRSKSKGLSVTWKIPQMGESTFQRKRPAVKGGPLYRQLCVTVRS